MREIGEVFDFTDLSRWLSVSFLGLGAAISFSFQLGSFLNISPPYLEIFYLFRTIVISPFAYLYLHLPGWLSWLFSEQLAHVYAFLVFLMPTAYRGIHRAALYEDNMSSILEDHDLLFPTQVFITHVIVCITCTAVIAYIWFDGELRFLVYYFSKMIITIIYVFIFYYITSYIYRIIEGNNVLRNSPLLRDSIRAIYILLYLSANIYVILYIYMDVFSSGVFPLYMALTVMCFFMICTVWVEWRIIPAILLSSAGIILGNILVENIFSPAWEALYRLAQSLPGYGV